MIEEAEDQGPELGQHDPRRLEEIQELQRAMARGFDVEAFMRSEIGGYFRLRASRELEEAQDKLVEHNPFDADGMRLLQMQAQVAQRVLTWFADAVREGENAAAQFQVAFDQSQGS